MEDGNKNVKEKDENIDYYELIIKLKWAEIPLRGENNN